MSLTPICISTDDYVSPWYYPPHITSGILKDSFTLQISSCDQMELSAEILGGLQLAGDSVRITEKCFERLLSKAATDLLVDSGQPGNDAFADPEFEKIDQGVLKQAYFGFLSLFVEAAKNGVEQGIFQSVLDDCKVPQERIALICKAYENNKSQFANKLKSVTFHLPHIVDVKWRLDYCIKGSHIQKINQALYLISLVIEGDSKETETITLNCTTEQLQDLVGKLKDAVKCWEKKAEILTT